MTPARVACMVSGGKDSILAAQVVHDWGWDITAFLTLLPRADAPLLFHRPNAKWVELQADAVGVPWITEDVADESDEEPALGRLFAKAEADGITTGALASEFQRTRFERAAHAAGLKTFSPLWHHEPLAHAGDVTRTLSARFVHVAAEGLTKSWLGREFDASAVADLATLKRVNAAGEGGEYETFVTDAPIFRERIEVTRAHSDWRRDDGTWTIEDARLVAKNP